MHVCLNLLSKHPRSKFGSVQLWKFETSHDLRRIWRERLSFQWKHKRKNNTLHQNIMESAVSKHFIRQCYKISCPLEWILSETQEITSTGEDRQLEPLCTASGTVEWYSHYGKQHSGSWNRIITSPQRTESRASKLLHTMAAAAWWRSNPSVLRWMAGQTWRGLHIQWNIIRPEKGRKLTPATTRVNLEDIRLREVS